MEMVRVMIAPWDSSAEGAVLGADGTSTTFMPGPERAPRIVPQRFDCAHESLEIRMQSTSGITVRCLGGVDHVSFWT